ncbi:hypothetical protein [Desulforhopalus sp. 52FAK]
MKYAFIAMLAVYLVTFGCNPKSEEEHSAPEKKVEHASVESAPATPAPPTNVHVKTEVSTTETEKAAAATEVAQAEPEAHVETATEAKPVVAEKVEENADNQWQVIAHNAATTVLALMNDDTAQDEPAKVEAVVETVEADKTVAKNSAAQPPCATPGTPCPKKDSATPCVKAGEPCPKAGTVAPCGKNIPQDAKGQPPCMKREPVAKGSAAPVEEPELSEPMMNLVNATNDMVAITRQLVIATQQMLSASKEVAVEVIDSGKDALEASKPAVQNAVNEQEIIETVKEVVAATKEAYEATSEALSNALEAKEAAPAVEAAPKQ